MDLIVDQSTQPTDWPAPGEKLQPAHRNQVGEWIQKARAARLSIGPPSATYSWDLSRVNNVTAFTAPDMLITVETGQTLDSVKDLVESEKLWLPLDTTHQSDVTLAEYPAQDHSISWLSHRYGTARDWVMQITAMDDKGQEVNSGARVVKNAAGYQLAPLYIGSMDALGPLVETTFRLLPLPDSLTVVEWQSASHRELYKALRAARECFHSSGKSDPWEGMRLEYRGNIWAFQGVTCLPIEKVEAWLHAANIEANESIASADTPPREADRNNFTPALRIHALPTRIPELLEVISTLEEDLICYPAAGVIQLGPVGETTSSQNLTGILSAVAAKGGRVRQLTTDQDIQIPEAAGMAANKHILTRIKRILDPEGVFGPLPEHLWL